MRQFDFMVPHGELFSFIGPNGDGKTPTIKMIGGILTPSRGHIKIASINMAQRPVDAKHRIGFIPVWLFLCEKLTVMEFKRFSVNVYRVEHDRLLIRAMDLLERFALSDWA